MTKEKGQPQNRTSPSNICVSYLNIASTQPSGILQYLQQDYTLTVVETVEVQL